MRSGLALALLLALGACVTTPRAPLPARDEPVMRGALSAWRATGRLGVKSLDTGFSAAFDWQESGHGSTVDVHGPLGLGAVHITRTAERIVIDNGRGPPLGVDAPFDALEDALAARLGAPLPLAPLRYWLLGLPDPEAPVERDADNRFSQFGWLVTATDPAPVAGVPAPLPRQLLLERPPTRIRVIIEDWRVAVPAPAPVPPAEAVAAHPGPP